MNNGVDQCDPPGALLNQEQQCNAQGNMGARGVKNLSALSNSAFGWVTKNKRRLKPIVSIIALGFFCVGLFISLRVSPDIWERIEFGPLLAILLVTLPLSLVISAADFQIMARLTGIRVGLWSAAEISIFSRAANMLPIPGSFAVRLSVLKAEGAKFKQSGGLMLLFTALWGGLGFCFSALWLANQAPIFLTLIFSCIGMVVLLACMWAIRQLGLDWRLMSRVGGLRLMLIALEAFALMLAVHSIGVDVAYHQTAILVVASFLAGIIPAGIGVRETILALLAPIAGIDPASGFLAGAAARVVDMAFLAMCAGVSLLHSHKKNARIVSK